MIRDTLLIIDDSELDRAILNEIFKNLFHVECVANATQGMQYLREHAEQVCAVLLDLCLERRGAGFDVLHTVALMAKAKNQPITAEIHTHKGPASLKNTPLFTEELMTTPERTVLAGTAAEAIQVLPTKVNVAVAAALASIGPDAMGAKITSVEGFAGDDHCITMETDGLKVTSDVYSRTAEIAGWSIVSLLQNLASPVVLF